MMYLPNEKVLCFHGPLVYQAKVSLSPASLVLHVATCDGRGEC